MKSKHIFPDFIDYISNFDFIGFQETKLTDLDAIQLENFTLFTKNRVSRSRVASGGIALAVKKHLASYITMIDTDSSLVLWFKISKTLTNYDTDILCGITYFPPENTRYASVDPFVEIQTELESLKCDNDYFLLFGDFNARTGGQNEFVDVDEFLLQELNLDVLEWEYNEERSMFENNNILINRTVSDKCSNNYGYKLIDFCKRNNFYILNGRLGKEHQYGRTTCRNASCIDYFISNNSMFEYLYDMSVDDFCPLLSDVHNPVLLTLSFKHKTFVTIPPIDENAPEGNYCKLWDRCNPDKFVDCIDMLKLCEVESKLDNFIDSSSIEKLDVDLIVQEISSLFTDSSQKAYGTQYSENSTKFKPNKNRPKNKPWFGKDCDTARKDFHTAKNRFNNLRTNTNKQNMKLKGNSFKRITRMHYRRYINKNANKIKNIKSSDPKIFWRIISSKEKSAPKVSIDAFYEFMKSLNTNNREDIDDFPDPDTQKSSAAEQLNSKISMEEIRNIAMKLTNGKSCGLDSVLNEHIKSTLHLMLPIYHKLFNIIFDTGIIPTAWTEGCIIPIYKKKGSNLNPENYRPITLLSCFGKLFTAIINSRLQAFATEFEIMNEIQTGFRKSYATIDNAFSLYVLFDLLSKSKRKMYCAFIDFQKAFDTVWRAGLWQKLIDSHIRGKCFTVIYNMYQGIKSCVSINGKMSSFFQCLIGLRQGENLSPFLFSIYLNDLEYYLRTNNVAGIDCTLRTDELFMYFKIFALLYADDTVLFADSSADLQHALNIFEHYCKDWKLTVNTAKTKVMIFGRGRRSQNISFVYNKEDVEIVNSFKYLGIIFSRGGSFAMSVKHNCEQASKAMFVLLRKTRSLNLSIDLQIELFDKMIKPILLYGCELWGFSNIKIIERVQLHFLKLLFNLKQSTPNVMVYGEFGVYPLDIDIKTRMISYWIKLIEPNSLKFSSLLYKFMFHNTSEKSTKWLDHVRNVMINCGFSGFWDAQKVDNPRWLTQSIKQKLKDLYVNEWFSDLENSPSCINYRLYKNTFILENYLLKLPNPMKRNFCLFRTRNHRLPIETGKWFNIDITERKCNLCNVSLGDEFHYLLCCNKLILERKRYIKSYYYQQPNILKFNKLMNIRNIKELKNLCKFIKIILTSCTQVNI